MNERVFRRTVIGSLAVMAVAIAVLFWVVLRPEVVEDRQTPRRTGIPILNTRTPLERQNEEIDRLEREMERLKQCQRSPAFCDNR